MKFVMFVVLFLLLGGFFIISNEDIHLNSSDNVDLFLSSYGKWIDGLVVNMGEVSGYVVKMEWLPNQ